MTDKMRAAFAMAAILVCGSGCVSTKTVPLPTDQDLATRSPEGTRRTIAPVIRATPDFSAMTAGKAGFGLIGAAAMISAGNQIVKANEIADPAIAIREKLIREFAARRGLELVPSVAAALPANATDVGRIVKSSATVDLLLDVQTVNWSFAYFPTDWNSYRVIYSVKVRLIDTKSRMTIAEGFCQRFPDKSADAPSRDQLLDNRAAMLKAQLNLHGGQCLTELEAKVFAPGAPLVAR